MDHNCIWIGCCTSVHQLLTCEYTCTYAQRACTSVSCCHHISWRVAYMPVHCDVFVREQLPRSTSGNLYEFASITVVAPETTKVGRGEMLLKSESFHFCPGDGLEVAGDEARQCTSALELLQESANSAQHVQADVRLVLVLLNKCNHLRSDSRPFRRRLLSVNTCCTKSPRADHWIRATVMLYDVNADIGAVAMDCDVRTPERFLVEVVGVRSSGSHQSAVDVERDKHAPRLHLSSRV